MDRESRRACIIRRGSRQVYDVARDLYYQLPKRLVFFSAINSFSHDKIYHANNVDNDSTSYDLMGAILNMYLKSNARWVITGHLWSSTGAHLDTLHFCTHNLFALFFNSPSIASI